MIKNEFSKNVLTLMTGTVVGQAIPIALIPILTRMFSPTDFGLLALYSAIISILGVIATGRYEIAIMLPEKDEDARSLLQASVLIAMSISAVISIPIFIWNAELAMLLGNEEIAPWLYLVPISVLLKGIYQALTYWNNRHKRFKNTAVSRVSQSGWQGITQVSLGYFKIFGGLIIGQVIGLFSSVIYLLGRENNHQKIFKNVSKVGIKSQVNKYDKLPKYSVLGGLCDSGAMQMPILMLTQFYTSNVTGLFSLTFRILNVPTSIISSAINQVLFQKVVEINNTDPASLNKYIIKVFIFLFALYLPAVPILIFWGEALFSFVFGSEWSQAGNFAGYLVIAVAIRFAVSPLSAVLGLEKNIKLGVCWQVLYLFTISVTLYILSSLSVELFFIGFVIHEVILYLIYFALILKGSKSTLI